MSHFGIRYAAAQALRRDPLIGGLLAGWRFRLEVLRGRRCPHCGTSDPDGHAMRWCCLEWERGRDRGFGYQRIIQ